MEKVVLDTSVIVKWFSKEGGHRQALEILDKIVTGEVVLMEPELIFYELINACWFGRKFTIRRIKRIMNEFINLNPEIQPVEPKLMAAILKLIKKFPLTAYDASFIALAEEFKISLITADTKHHKKAFSKFIIPLGEI